MITPPTAPPMIAVEEWWGVGVTEAVEEGDDDDVAVPEVVELDEEVADIPSSKLSWTPSAVSMTNERY